MQKRVVVRNAAYNWLGVISEAAVAFFLTPFLIARLGESDYGLWIYLSTVAGYVLMLDLGLRGAVGRFIAYYHAQQDELSVRRTFATAVALLVGVGLLGCGLMAGAAFGLERIFPDRAADADRLRPALLLLGLHLAIWFPSVALEGVLWGHQRFDLLKSIDIAAAILRGVTAAVAVGLGYGIIGLAWTTLGVTLAVVLCRVAMCLRIMPLWELRRAHVRRESIRELWGYGLWSFAIAAAGQGKNFISQSVVMRAFGAALNTPYTLANRLVGYGGMFLTEGAGALTPVLTSLHARNEQQQQRWLVTQAGRVCLAWTLFVFAALAFLSKSFLTLWVGEQFAWVWLPVVILMAGELVPQSASVFNNSIRGMARHRAIAWRGAAECLVGPSLGWLLADHFGLPGLCAGMAFGAMWFRGVFVLVYGCRILNLPVWEYLRETVPALLVRAAAPIAALAAATHFAPPEAWWSLIGYCLAFAGLYAAAVGTCIPQFMSALVRVRSLAFRLARIRYS